MCAENFLLKVENLTTDFQTEGGVIRAVDNVSFAVRAGEVLSLVGESGCGKSVASYSILRLIPSPHSLASRKDYRRQGHFPRNRSAVFIRLADAALQRQGYLNDFSGTNDFLESGLHHRRAIG